MNSLIDSYTVEELKDIVRDSHSFKEVLRKIGFKSQNGRNSNTLRKRLEAYNIPTKHFGHVEKIKRTPENVFCKNSTATQHVLRRWYSERFDDSFCELCGQQKTWNKKPLTMILDHINGDNRDHRIENLRWICPNCNSQLDTFAGRNSRKRSCS